MVNGPSSKKWRSWPDDFQDQLYRIQEGVGRGGGRFSSPFDLLAWIDVLGVERSRRYRLVLACDKNMQSQVERMTPGRK